MKTGADWLAVYGWDEYPVGALDYYGITKDSSDRDIMHITIKECVQFSFLQDKIDGVSLFDELVKLRDSLM